MRVQMAGRAADPRLVQALATRYDSIADNESHKKADVRKQADDDQRMYDALNYRDDQFDLSDTLAAIAISLLAVASVTHKRWLYLAALVPTVLAVLMGLSGLLGWHVHPSTIVGWLS
jgi:hypothetical protein